MPEAAVHEDARAVFGQHDVGSPGQCADTFAEPVSTMPQFTPDCLFGACVLRVYAGHAIVALFGCHAVRHGSMSVDYFKALPADQLMGRPPGKPDTRIVLQEFLWPLREFIYVNLSECHFHWVKSLYAFG